MTYDLSPMRSGVLASRKCYVTQTRAFILTMTWMLLLIIYGQGGRMSTAQAQTQTRLYVTDPCLNHIVVLDPATSSVIATIPSGADPSDVVVSPDGSRVYIPNNVSGTVSVISTATNTVIATIVSGGGRAAITPDGSRLYVASLSGTIFVIDTATNTVSQTIPIGGFLDGIAITPDGTRAYITNNSQNAVIALNLATNTVITTIPVGIGPRGIAILPFGTVAFVANTGSDLISEIDITRNIVDDNDSHRVRNPKEVVFSPTDGHIYVATGDNTVVGVDVTFAENPPPIIIPVGNTPARLVVAPNGTLYVANLNDGTVSVIQNPTAPNPLVTSIRIGSCAVGIGLVSVPLVPTDKDQCKNGGYRNFGPPAGPFRNQGQCVSYVETHAHH
jgi:YVTN family beta-propeller protein